MKQHAIVNIIGSGTENDMYRADVTCDHAAQIPTGPDGRPINTWCVVQADSLELVRQPRCTVIPDSQVSAVVLTLQTANPVPVIGPVLT